MESWGVRLTWVDCKIYSAAIKSFTLQKNRYVCYDFALTVKQAAKITFAY